MPKPTFTLQCRLPRPILALLACITVSIYLYLKLRPDYSFYENFITSEVDVSQKLIHNSQQQKYVLFKQLQGAGFNNQAQEILLFHHLALQTSRVYVYQPLVWRPRGENATVPLSAFLKGPTKNTISAAVFDEICPDDEVTHLNLVTDHRTQWESAVAALDGPERCIIVDDWLFNWNFLASSGIHVIWPSYRKYLANHFEWSESILTLVEKAQSKLNLTSKSSSKDGDPYMSLHLRRGDFEDHCHSLADNHVGFTSWATLPNVQPAVLLPSLDPTNETSVLEHCYPSLYRILAAITHQALAHPTIRTLHVLHDGAWDHPLVYLQYYKIIEALKNAAWAERQGWPGGPMLRVTQSADVPLGWGEKDWAVCVDVELARRAEIFIGNGYSSLSTQIVALRLADDSSIEDMTLV